MTAKRFALPALCALSLGACALAPPYKTPEIAVPSEYKGTAGMWHVAQPSDDLKRGDWWLRFHDPVLDQLMSRLDYANSDLSVAIAHYDLANAYAAQARAGFYPTVNSAAYTTRNRQSDNRALRSKSQPDVYGDNALGLISSYELDLWGRVRNVAQAAQAGAQAASADLESIKLSLRAELASTYLELRVADAKQQLLAGEVDSYTKAVKLTQNRFQGKIDSALNVSRAKAQLDTAKAHLSENTADRALFEHAIATLVGEPASSFSIAPTTTDLNLPNIPVGIPAALLQRRPDIAAAERRLAQANAEIGVARAAFFPNITLAASAGVESTYMPGLISAPNLFWSIGPSALLTIFDAGKRKAVEAQAQAAFDIAGGQYRGTVLRAFQEVEDSLSQLNELAKEATALRDAVTDTQNALDIAMNLFREGTISYLEVVTAQTAAQQARLDELSVRNKRLQATVLLIRALGGGWNGQIGMADAQ